MLLRLAAAALLPRLAAAQYGPFPACPTDLPRQADYSVKVLQRSVCQGGGALISQAAGSSAFPANFNTAWFPGNGADVPEGLVVRVGAWKTHPEWTSSGALAIIPCNFTPAVPTTGNVTADAVVWPGVRAPAPDERWGALDPRIGYRPETQNYYLAWDNGTHSCGYRQTQLSTSKDPHDRTSWTHHGQVLGGLDAQESTAGAGFLFQPSPKPSFAFVATGSNRHMNSEEVIVIASTSEAEPAAPWKLRHCELNATNQCCADFISPPYFDGRLRPESAACISENCCSKRPQCLAGVTEPRYCEAPKLGGMVGEGCDLELQCPPGEKISQILFADWGLPVATGGAGPTDPGACAFQSQGNCTSADATKRLVERLCVGKNACTLSTANTHDPDTVNEVDPCHGHHKRLAVAATGCSAAPPPTPPRDPKIGRQVLISPRPTCWDRGGICAGPSPQQLSNGDWLYVYDHDSHNASDPSGRCSVGWSILSKDDPSRVVARGAEPVLTAVLSFEMTATVNSANSSGTANVVFADGLRAMGGDKFMIIFGAADTDVGAALIQVTVKPRQQKTDDAVADPLIVAAPPAPVLPPNQSVDVCVDARGRNVSCGPTTSQRCQNEEIWPRPKFHVMDFYCQENDPNGPFVSEHGIFHLFFQDHLGLPNRNASWPGAGLSWAHAASPDLAHWVWLPIGLWGGEPISDRDCGGLSTGSTTMVNGVPTIVYPGGCHPADPNAAGVPGGIGAGGAYSAAVPADPSDKLLKTWKRLGPLINDTDNDPSEAWRTSHGEWRLVGHGGGGKCTPGGPLNGSACAPMWATADPSFLTGWYKVGVSGLLSGECQNFYRLPALYPGTSAPAGAPLPSHVHHSGGKYMLGSWVDGAPGVGDSHTGTWTPTPGVPFAPILEDHGSYYASKGFNDNRTGSSRRLIYGWNRSPPASQTLPRVVTYDPRIQRLVFSPPPELELLRKTRLPTLPNNTALETNVSTPINSTAWPVGAGSVAEVRVRWKRPAAPARLSLTVMMGPGGRSSTVAVDYVPPPPGSSKHNVSVDGTCSNGRGANAFSCEGLWLLRSDEVIELTAFVDTTVIESFWMDGRVVLTSGVAYDGRSGGMAVEAETSGPPVVLESVQAWGLNSCWINETEALRLVDGPEI